MSVLSLVNVRHSYGSRAILDGATLSVEQGEKIGLVGRNGSGKTTLMKVMTGQIVPDSGNVGVQRAARVGYLSQDPDLDPDDSVRDAAERAFAQLHDLHVRMHHLYEEMAGMEGDALDRLLKQQAKLEAEMETAGGYAIDHRIDAMLHGLGFSDEQFTLKVTSLSGGQKGRLGLARLLLEEPDVLLLDEPTNHLDIAGRQWLETFLAEEYPGAVIVVSHDRWLLDRVVHRIIEVERGMIREYPGNYHDYVALRRERQLTEARVYDKQMGRIKQEQSYIDKYRAGQRARQAKGREARLERFKRDEVMERPIELEVMNLKLPPAARSGDQIIVAEGISKSYDKKILFRNLELTVTRSDRIGIIGPNGAGKTTLIKCLLGEGQPDEGKVRLGSRLNIGYYRQLHEHLDMSLSVWQYLQSVIVGMDGSAKASEQQARDLAGAFLFSGMEQDKPLGSLSGGERSRAVLAGLVAGAHNVLVLDEPSNHLDIPSAERLEQSLSSAGGFEGTLLLITHDRQLLEDVCDRLVILDGEGGARVFPGRYSEWEDRQRREREEAAARKDEATARRARGGGKDHRTHAEPQAAGGTATTATAPKAKGPHARLKVEELEKKIAVAQARVADIDQAMGDPAVYVDGAKVKALQVDRAHAEVELQELEDEWLRRADQDQGTTKKRK